MRTSSLVSLLFACVGCHSGISLGAISVRSTVRAEARVRVQPAVPITGSTVVEFFGIPLDEAQDVVFVVDGSGSMAAPAQGPIAPGGNANATPNQTVTSSPPPSASPITTTAPPVRSKMDAAHEELVDALLKLPEGTRLNVIFFNETIDAFTLDIVPLEGAVRDLIAAFVKQRAPEGGTALGPALRTAFLMNARRVVLLSDGLGNIGGDARSILRDAREAMRGNVRIDTIGLGSDQDAELLRTLAADSGGIYQRL